MVLLSELLIHFIKNLVASFDKNTYLSGNCFILFTHY